MIPPRQREAEAIALLVDLIRNVDEWSEEHHDTAQLAAREAAAWLRRAKVGEPPVKRRSTGATMRSRKASDGPTEATRIHLIARSGGGWCEITHAGCTGAGTEVHHRLMRSQGGGHDEENLMLLCATAHRYVHANPEYSYERGWLLHRVTA